MADDRSRKLTGAVPTPSPRPGTVTGASTVPARPGTVTGASTVPARGTVTGASTLPARDPRVTMMVPVRYRYQSFIDFIESQSMNISRSGMFLASNQSLPIGTSIDFELALADGMPLLKGKGEVVRISVSPPGLGIRFQQIDESSQRLIERIVQINLQEGKKPSVTFDFAERDVSELRNLKGATGIAVGVEFAGRSLRLQINTGTAGYFTNNPLLNIRLGGFVVPTRDEVPLGTLFSVTIENGNQVVLWTGKGKVVAKHEMRLGIRLADVPKDVLARLQAEVTKVAPGK
jgi:uncharacterized protein (TIGR02266 family)